MFQVFNFLSSNLIWIGFFAVVAWIIFVPQISRLFKGRKNTHKTQRFLVE